MRRRVALGAVVAATLATAGCSSGASNKAGAETLVMRLASIDAVNVTGQSYGPEAFVTLLESVSDGQIRVEVDDTFRAPAVTAESDLVRAIAAGDVHGGWPATRAFARAGFSGLEVVEAPMTITSYAAQKELVQSDLATRLLLGLEGTGVVGLDLTVGPLRRPFAGAAPLLGLEDWPASRSGRSTRPSRTRSSERWAPPPTTSASHGPRR